MAPRSSNVEEFRANLKSNASWLEPFDSPPAFVTLTRVVDTAPTSSKMPSPSVSRSRRKASVALLVSLVIRLVANDEMPT